MKTLKIITVSKDENKEIEVEVDDEDVQILINIVKAFGKKK